MNDSCKPRKNWFSLPLPGMKLSSSTFRGFLEGSGSLWRDRFRISSDGFCVLLTIYKRAATFIASQLNVSVIGETRCLSWYTIYAEKLCLELNSRFEVKNHVSGIFQKGQKTYTHKGGEGTFLLEAFLQ